MHIDTIYSLGPFWLIFAALVAFFAGVVKGTTGFAMPLLIVSILGSVFPPTLALAALILPTLVSNLWQAVRQGPVAALRSARVHWRFLIVMLLCMVIGAQVVIFLPPQMMFLILGVLVFGFSLMQLWGWQPDIQRMGRRTVELVVGAIAGVLGGFSGVWGPPTVLYLTAMETPKHEQMRVQGVIYGLGSVMLTLAHLQSGVLSGGGLRLSALLVPPALIGLLLGFRLLDRMDQAVFKRVTLLVLLVAGANLIRRGIMG